MIFLSNVLVHIALQNVQNPNVIETRGRKELKEGFVGRERAGKLESQ